jgi:hypothetical protein
MDQFSERARLDSRKVLTMVLTLERQHERQIDLANLRSWHLESADCFAQFAVQSLGASLPATEVELRSVGIKALAALDAGRRDEAGALCDALFRLQGGDPLGYYIRSLILFPGPTYIERLTQLHRLRKPLTYVEIGVATGSSMACAEPPTTCIGIDPEPAADLRFDAPTRIFPLSSDAFFQNHDLRSVLNGRPVDLAFIDGMHVFENVLSDFANLERFCSADGVVMLHDCWPIDAAVASRERVTAFWTGDVWRMLPVLACFRPDLSITVMKCAPSGLALVSHLDPGSLVLAKQRERAIAYGMSIDFEKMPSLESLGVMVDG